MITEPVLMVISGQNPFSSGETGFIAGSGTSANATALFIIFTHAVLDEVVASS